MKRHLLFVIIVLLICSCTFNTKNIELRKIDNVNFEVRYLKNVIRSYHRDSLIFYSSKIKESLKIINESPKKTYNDDFHSQYIIPFTDAGNIIDDCNLSLRKIFERLSKSEKQLLNLKTDVKKGLLSKSEFKVYFSQEKKVVDEINNDFLILRSTLTYNVLLYKRISPVINKITEELKSEK
jgi:hypothetical protein